MRRNNAYGDGSTIGKAAVEVLADLKLPVAGVRVVKGQVAVHEHAFVAGHPQIVQHFDVPLGHAVDRAVHDRVQDILVAFQDAGDRFKRPVCIVLVPRRDLLLGRVGQTKQFPVAADHPQDLHRGTHLGHVQQRQIVEQMRRPHA